MRNPLGSTVAAPRIIELLMLGNGHFQFSFSNEASVIYEVLGTTNLALPLAQWTALSPPVSWGGDLYRFTDILTTNRRSGLKIGPQNVPKRQMV